MSDAEDTVLRVNDIDVYYVISRENGALKLEPEAFVIDPTRIRVGPPGAWADDPEIREPGRLPWGDGEPGVTEFPDPDD